MSTWEGEPAAGRGARVAAALVLVLLVAGGVYLATAGRDDPEREDADAPDDELVIETDADPPPSPVAPDDDMVASTTAGSWRSLPDAPIPPRTGALVVWADGELLVWGGRDGDGARADGAAFDPAADRWRTLPEAPDAPALPTLGAWTGDRLVVLLADGASAAYDPAADRWESLPDPPDGPWSAVTALGGEAVLVGDRAAVGMTGLGGWRRLPTPPLDEIRTSATTGGRLVVVGSRGGTPALAAYDPVDGRWSPPEAAELPGDVTPTAAGNPDGYRLLVVRRAHTRESSQAVLSWESGDEWRLLPRLPSALLGTSPEPHAASGGVVLWAPFAPAVGAFLRPGMDAWLPLGRPPATVGAGAQAAWTGEELLVWGGDDRPGGAAWRPPDGVRLPPADAPRLPGEWRTLPVPPEPRHEPTLTWTGEQLVAWGGTTGRLDGDLAPGGTRFDVDEGVWAALPEAPIGPRTGHVAAWTGEEVLIWGGEGPSGPERDGAAYDPSRDGWRRLLQAPLPASSPVVSAWVGQEWLVAVGSGSAVAAYDPAEDAWVRLPDPPSDAGAPLGITGTPWGVLLVTERGAWSLEDGQPDRWLPRGAHSLTGPVTLAVDGQDVVALGAGGAARYEADSGYWRGAALAWEDTPAASAAWSGRRLLVWGAVRVGDVQLGRLAAAAYDPDADRWSVLPDPPQDVGVGGPAVWTGEEVVWWQAHGGPVAFRPDVD